jgi:hypothetical protein
MSLIVAICEVSLCYGDIPNNDPLESSGMSHRRGESQTAHRRTGLGEGSHGQRGHRNAASLRPHDLAAPRTTIAGDRELAPRLDKRRIPQHQRP